MAARRNRSSQGFPERPASLAAFGEALRKRRQELGITLDRLAISTRISKPYLSNIETGRTPGPATEEKLRLIAGSLALPAEAVVLAGDWLRTPAAIRRLVVGDGAGAGRAVGGGESAQAGRRQGPLGDSGQAGGSEEMPRRPDGTIDLDALLRQQGTAAKDPDEHATRPAGEARGLGRGMMPVRPVPLINRVAAGQPAEFTDLGYPAGFADRYLPAPVGGTGGAPGEEPDAPPEALTCSFALRVIGDSMSPEYQEGEILLVGPGWDAQTGAWSPRDGDDCVVRFADEENYATTFKRIYFVKEAGAAEEAAPTALRLVPLNPAHREWTVPLEQVTGIYPVLYRLLPARRGSATRASAREGHSQFAIEQD
ncbi:MAG TPA: XRE family transcriptional regulator [Phycisphaerae bacterium]|nr:XRE family transcriptional regulator [Phycisphaerae bacterium]